MYRLASPVVARRAPQRTACMEPRAGKCRLASPVVARHDRYFSLAFVRRTTPPVLVGPRTVLGAASELHPFGVLRKRGQGTGPHPTGPYGMLDAAGESRFYN